MPACLRGLAAFRATVGAHGRRRLFQNLQIRTDWPARRGPRRPHHRGHAEPAPRGGTDARLRCAADRKGPRFVGSRRHPAAVRVDRAALRRRALLGSRDQAADPAVAGAGAGAVGRGHRRDRVGQGPAVEAKRGGARARGLAARARLAPDVEAEGLSRQRRCTGVRRLGLALRRHHRPRQVYRSSAPARRGRAAPCTACCTACCTRRAAHTEDARRLRLRHRDAAAARFPCRARRRGRGGSRLRAGAARVRRAWRRVHIGQGRTPRCGPVGEGEAGSGDCEHSEHCTVNPNLPGKGRG